MAFLSMFFRIFRYSVIVLTILTGALSHAGNRCEDGLLGLDRPFGIEFEEGAIAVFVKTPGVSPVKTRLAASIGKAYATGLYIGSVLTTREVVKNATENESVRPYWAIAEDSSLTDNFWSDFQGVSQGNGGLGDRLAKIYNDLIRIHSYVIFIGADTPHLPIHLIREAIQHLKNKQTPQFVIGPALDGGFYLFGGNTPIPTSTWLNVEYSTERTAEQLVSGLREIDAPISFLDPITDIDTLEDLRNVEEYYSGHRNLIQSQRVFFRELKRVLNAYDDQENSSEGDTE